MVKRLGIILLVLVLALAIVPVNAAESKDFAGLVEKTEEELAEEAVRVAELMIYRPIRTVTKAHKTQSALENAETLVRALPAGPVKTQLQERLWTVQVTLWGFWASGRVMVPRFTLELEDCWFNGDVFCSDLSLIGEGINLIETDDEYIPLIDESGSPVVAHAGNIDAWIVVHDGYYSFDPAGEEPIIGVCVEDSDGLLYVDGGMILLDEEYIGPRHISFTLYVRYDGYTASIGISCSDDD